MNSKRGPEPTAGALTGWLEEALSGRARPKPKLVVVTTPNNPTGVVIPGEHLRVRKNFCVWPLGSVLPTALHVKSFEKRNDATQCNVIADSANLHGKFQSLVCGLQLNAVGPCPLPGVVRQASRYLQTGTGVLLGHTVHPL